MAKTNRNGTIRIGTNVPNVMLTPGVVAVIDKTWTEYGTRVYNEKNTIKLFDNEDQYWKWMERNKKKTFKTKNEDGTETHRTIRYMPRYEVAGLASYDDNIKFQQMTYDETSDKFFTTPRKAQKQVITMAQKNIFAASLGTND